MAWFRRDAHPEEQLPAYIDGELDTRARRAIEAHLAGCEACNALAAELRQSKSLLAALPRRAPARSFVLGAEYAVQRRPEPRRSSFTFAPVAALTVLVALLFVDAANFSGSSTSQDSAGGASPLDAPAAARQAESAEKDDAAGAASDAFQAPTAAGASQTPNQGPAPSAAGPNPTAAPPVAQDRAAPAEEGERATLTVPEQGPDDSSGGISTLRILEIVAALALVASLAVVYLPRVIRS